MTLHRKRFLLGFITFFCIHFCFTASALPVCNGSTFAGFSSYRFTPRLHLKIASQATYERSKKFHGYPRIRTVMIDAQDAGTVSAILSNATGMTRPNIDHGNTPLSLQELLPDIARLYTNQYLEKESGSNCFNAVINWFNNTTDLRNTSYKAILSFLKNHFSEVPRNDEIRFGDVLLISRSETFPLHAAIYIESDLYWHKASAYKEDPWTFELMRKQMQSYCTTFGGKIEARFFRKR